MQCKYYPTPCKKVVTIVRRVIKFKNLSKNKIKIGTTRGFVRNVTSKIL